MTIPNARPSQAFDMSADDLYAEASNFLDGKPIETEGQATEIARIRDAAKQLRKDADAKRAEEKRPHDEAAKAVQAEWKPVLLKCDDVIQGVQKPLTEYLTKQEEARIAEAQRRQAEADALAERARAAARHDDLASKTAARELGEEAVRMQKAATRIEKAKSHVAGAGRATHLRTYTTAHVDDYRALLTHVVDHDRPAISAFLDDYANKALPTKLPGVSIRTERKVA